MNGITSDNLLATDATATPIFWAVNPIILKRVINKTPITPAQIIQSSLNEPAFNGKDPFTTEPVTTQVK